MIFFSADQHWYHLNVIRYCNRPYSSVEEMNEDMVSKWNSVVGPQDSVYVLGDVSLAFRPVEVFSPRLNGTRFLVPGNHDWCHSYHKKGRKDLNKWIDRYSYCGWNVLPEQTTLTIDGIGEINLCHHPYGNENSGKNDAMYQDKYARWRPADNGKILLCGHVHDKWHTKRSPAGTLMINVGVDVNKFYPISEKEIIEIIKNENST